MFDYCLFGCFLCLVCAICSYQIDSTDPSLFSEEVGYEILSKHHKTIKSIEQINLQILPINTTALPVVQHHSTSSSTTTSAASLASAMFS